MPWREIKTNEVLADLTPMEQALLQNILVDTQNANLAAKVVSVSKQIRGQIKGGGNQVDQCSTFSLPDQVIDDAIHLIRWNWITSVSQLKTMQTPERREAAKNAEARFRGIAAYGDPKRERIELPASADTTPAAVPLPSVSHSKYDRRKRREEDGIV